MMPTAGICHSLIITCIYNSMQVLKPGKTLIYMTNKVYSNDKSKLRNVL